MRLCAEWSAAPTRSAGSRVNRAIRGLGSRPGGKTPIANPNLICPQTAVDAARVRRAARLAMTVRSSGGSSTVKSAPTEAR